MDAPRAGPAARTSLELYVLLGVVLAGHGLVACVDLFHSTSDLRTACELDASACDGDASAAGAAETTPQTRAALGQPGSAAAEIAPARAGAPIDAGEVGALPMARCGGTPRSADWIEAGSDAAQPLGDAPSATSVPCSIPP